MPSESPNWRPLTQATLRGLPHGTAILAIRGDGKGYYGRVKEVTADYVMLANGSQYQLLKFFDSPTEFVVVQGPVRKVPTLAERKLV